MEGSDRRRRGRLRWDRGGSAAGPVQAPPAPSPLSLRGRLRARCMDVCYEARVHGPAAFLKPVQAPSPLSRKAAGGTLGRRLLHRRHARTAIVSGSRRCRSRSRPGTGAAGGGREGPLPKKNRSGHCTCRKRLRPAQATLRLLPRVLQIRRRAPHLREALAGCLAARGARSLARAASPLLRATSSAVEPAWGRVRACAGPRARVQVRWSRWLANRTWLERRSENA